MELFLEALEPGEGARVLDLGCGAGRHLEALQNAGLAPVGLDLSAELLRRAAAEHHRAPDAAAPRLVRGDMRRLPFGTRALDAVASFFTSFGYFSTVEEDREVLREVRRVLRPRGGFFLDFLHADHVRAHLVPEDRREVSGRTVVQRRHIEGPFVVKEIEISRPDRQTPETYEERVRLYESDELEVMLHEAGLQPEARLGGYDGGPLEPCSERMVLVGRKA